MDIALIDEYMERCSSFLSEEEWQTIANTLNSHNGVINGRYLFHELCCYGDVSPFYVYGATGPIPLVWGFRYPRSLPFYSDLPLIDNKVLSVIDDHGKLPFEHIDSFKELRLNLRPWWTPNFHLRIYQNDIHHDIALTIMSLLYIRDNIWTIIPRELAIKILGLIFNE